MPETVYLTALDVEGLHVFIMEKTGEAPSPLRDRLLLESAVVRPQMAAHYADADLVEQCALLAVGISQAQAFVEGNKRTAFIAGDVLLRANGCLLTGDPLEEAQQLEAGGNPHGKRGGSEGPFHRMAPRSRDLSGERPWGC